MPEINVNYNPTTWVNEETKLNALNMNNIDKGINDIIASLGEIPSWALISEKPSYTAVEVGADPTGTAADAVGTHNGSSSAHSTLFSGKANTVHTHTINQITDFPPALVNFPTPTNEDVGKVLSVNSQSQWAIGGTIPTKLSELENDAGYATTQMDLAEYEGGYVTTEQDFVFGFRPNHIIIEDYPSGSATPTSTHLSDDYSSGGTIVTFMDWGITIISPSNGEFNQTGHFYKVYGYAFPKSTPSIDGHLLIAENNTWVDIDPADVGLTPVVANPSGEASDITDKLKIGDTIYQLTVPMDSTLSSSSTNPVQNSAIYNQLILKEATANKVNSISTPNSTDYPTTQAVANYVGGQVVANSQETTTQVLSNIKVGSTVYEVKEGSPIIPITVSDFTSDDTSTPKRVFKFKISSADADTVAEKINGDFIISFQLAEPLYSLYGDAFAVSGRTYSGKKYFEGVIRMPGDTTQVLGETLNISMTYDASATYPFEMNIAYADSSITSSSKRAVSSSAAYTALQGKEDSANKVTSFSTTDNTTYPTTSAVASYLNEQIVANSGTSLTDLQYLKIGGATYRIPSPTANPMTTQGDLIVGGSGGAATRLAKGSAGQVLSMNSAGTTPEWSSLIQSGSGNVVGSTSGNTIGTYMWHLIDKQLIIRFGSITAEANLDTFAYLTGLPASLSIPNSYVAAVSLKNGESTPYRVWLSKSINIDAQIGLGSGMAIYVTNIDILSNYTLTFLTY